MFIEKIRLLFALIAHFSTEKESCIRVGLAQPKAGMNTDVRLNLSEPMKKENYR